MSADGLPVIYNDRSGANSRIANELSPERMAIAQMPREIIEGGVHYAFQARHAGQDPWLFLDLRAARRQCSELKLVNSTSPW